MFVFIKVLAALTVRSTRVKSCYFRKKK